MATNLDIKDNMVEVSVDPKFYPLDVVYAAAYAFLDKAYILLKGDPAKEIIVEMQPKANSVDPKKLGLDFNDQLLNCATYKQISEKNRETKEMLMKEIFSNVINRAADAAKDEFDGIMNEIEGMDEIDDPEGIMIPWEEKYGKKDQA